MPVDPSFILSPAVNVLPETVRNPNDPAIPLNAPLAMLSESARDVVGMVAFDAYLLHAFRIARYNPDALIASQGYETLDKMLELSSYEHPLRVLKAATLYKPWKLLPAVRSAKESQKKYGSTQPYDDAMEQYDFWNVALRNIVDPRSDYRQDFRHVLWNLMDAAHIGFTVQELLWRRAGEESPKELRGKWVLQQVVPRRPRQISFELDADTLAPRQLYSTTPLGGVQKKPIPLEKVILYTFNPRQGLPYGWGMARICYKHYWLIEQTLRSWAIAVKRTGLPFLEGVTNDPNGPSRLASLFAQMSDGNGLIHPGTDTIIPHFPSGNSGVVPESFIAYNESKITQTILGQTLTTNEGDNGSFAHAHVHQNTGNFFLAQPRHDIEEVASAQLIRRGSRYNFGADKEHLAPRLFLGHWNEEERLAVANTQEVYRNLGYLRAADIDWIRDEAGYPPDLSTIALEDVLTPEGLPGRERIQEDFTPGEPPGLPGTKPPKPEDPSHRSPTTRRTNPSGTPARQRG